MDPKISDVRSEDGLQKKGPLTGGISSIKVGVRPPDIPLIDHVQGLVGDLEKAGGKVPGGSSLATRSLDGFIQFPDLSARPIRPESVIRVIEFDPVRSVFLIGGDGEADLCSEISWYVLKAVPNLDAVLFLPDGGGSSKLPEDRDSRIDLMLGIAKLAKDGRMASSAGYTIIGLSKIDDLVRLDILYEKGSDDHSKSQ